MSLANIFLVGEVSSGKSSFLNCLTGALVSSVSLQRETCFPTVYRFSKFGEKANVLRFVELLEYFHKENMEMRTKIASMPLEEMCKPRDINEKYNLPMPFQTGLEQLNIIDFPGINDAEDPEHKYVQVIGKNINTADMVIYLTDASRAFVSASEVSSFAKIKTIVDNENVKGHYVKLIIVINKFDNYQDKDLHEIAEHVVKKSGIDKNSIYKVSSHKLLINRLITQKTEINVPKCAFTEMCNLLQHANVIINKNVKQSITQSGSLSYKDICYNESFDDDETIYHVSSIVSKTGDYDGVVKCLEDFTKILNQTRVNSIQDAINKTLTSYSDGGNLVEFFSKIYYLFDMVRSKNISMQVFLTPFKKAFTLSIKQKVNSTIIGIILCCQKYFKNDTQLFEDLYNQVFNPIASIDVVTRAITYLIYIKHSLCKKVTDGKDNQLKYLFPLLKNSSLWTNISFEYFDIDKNSTMPYIFESNTTIDIPVNIVHDIYQHSDHIIKSLIKLALINVHVIKGYLDTKMLDLTFIKKFDQTCYINLHLLLNYECMCSFVKNGAPDDNMSIRQYNTTVTFLLCHKIFSINMPLNEKVHQDILSLNTFNDNKE